MDDSNFDDLIKKKFEHYEDTDSSALESFQKLTFPQPSIPWYSKYRTEAFVISSLLVFSAINGFIFWNANDKAKNDKKELTNNLQHRVDSLTFALQQIQSNNQQPSVYIIEPEGKETMESNKRKVVTTKQVFPTSVDRSSLHSNDKIYLGATESIPPNILKRLQEADVLKIEGGQAYLIITDRIKLIRHKSYAFESPSELKITSTLNSIIYDDSVEKIKMELPEVKLTGHISSKLINKIEDHQHVRGVGINIAPHIDFAKGLYSAGTGGITPRFGVTAEWMVSPHWSVETSLDYFNTKMTLKNDFQSHNLPDLNSQLGDLKSVRVSTNTLSIPPNIKYKWWLTREHQLIVKTGYTPYFSFKNQYIYSYPFPGAAPDSDLKLSTVEEVDQSRYFGGTFNAVVGIGRLTKKKNQFEVALFYEKSLGSVGTQKSGMQLFGIRTAYSFKVR